jgi:predicted Ser/Thr protein kinase
VLKRKIKSNMRMPWAREVWEDESVPGLVTVRKCLQQRRRNAVLRRMQVHGIRREARILRHLNGLAPGVAPRVLDDSDEELVLEKLDGPVLSEYPGRLSGDADTYDALAAAVGRMHEAGVAHGELRLGNIMHHDGRLVIIDFETAVRKTGRCFGVVRTWDLLGLLWLKEYVFRLPLKEKEKAFRRRHRVLALLFRIGQARDMKIR